MPASGVVPRSTAPSSRREGAVSFFGGRVMGTATCTPCRPDGLPLARGRSGSRSTARVGEVTIGGPMVAVIAGPCAVEDYEGLLAVARTVKAAGATILRGGAYKPRTSPYSFQGLGREGLRILAEVGRSVGLPTVSEVVDERSLEEALAYVDMVQVGARNMQNFSLLRAVGRAGKPVLLKRGPGATVDEWLWAAEYVMAEGNRQVVLCERGIRTFEPATRYTLDLSAVPLVREA
ncbi:MAG: 3-deoxy-7-phosphoheptulonate synthase, partial [Firmicutes bacterium]|nr:3-deoxy-7-phosphoheptulonate synthase [Bacillota bacterium]